METIVKELYEAAVEGSVSRLLDLLQQDVLILDRCIIITSYDETPLHIASMLGHQEFCSELVTRKPKLTEQLDSRRSSALHLASANGYTEIVKILVPACPDMCLVYDKDGNNPIHIAIMKGKVEVLKELVHAFPDAACARVNIPEKWTVLHLCVQYYQIEALKFLVENLKDEELINAKDSNGNSVLHLAVAEKQVEMVQYLLRKGQMDVNARNSKGFKAIDILEQTRRDSKYIEIAHSLQQYAGQITEDKVSIITQGEQTESIKTKDINEIPKDDQNKPPPEDYAHWLEEQRNSIMIVAVLIATMGFQGIITPPGGLYSEGKLAGKSILGETSSDIYAEITFSNTVGFISSLSTILLLISGLRFRYKSFMWILMVIMWISISATAYTYLHALKAVGSCDSRLEVILAGVFDILVLLIVMHTIRFIRQRVRDWPIKGRVSMWITIFFVWITSSIANAASGYLEEDLVLNLGDDTVFPFLFIAWIVSTALLILLYAIQLIFLIIRKVKDYIQEIEAILRSNKMVESWFQPLKSYSSSSKTDKISSNKDKTQVVICSA